MERQKRRKRQHLKERQKRCKEVVLEKEAGEKQRGTGKTDESDVQKRGRKGRKTQRT